MSKNNLKIFLSYHKNTPVYKSDSFQPIQVGTELGDKLDFALKDNTGDNISFLNKYYCELTGHYWVLKNYIDTCEEEYIGFAHYRRLPDLKTLSDEDFPSIYGINYSVSQQLFEDLVSSDLYDYCKDYDVILPCSVYMYANTVNPSLREDEQHYNLYDHFKTEHKNNLLDLLYEIADDELKQYLSQCFSMEKAYFYNIYIMKKDLMKDFLSWQFDILEKLGQKIGGWEQEKYLRMAGFVAETLTNVWVKMKTDKQNLHIGHVPLYMIDFESEYIEKANLYHQQGLYSEEIKELEKLLEISSMKFDIYVSMAENYILLNNNDKAEKYFLLAKKEANSGEDSYRLAQIAMRIAKNEVYPLINEAIEREHEKLFASHFLQYAESVHDLDLTEKAWDLLKTFELTSDEQNRYSQFLRLSSMIKS